MEALYEEVIFRGEANISHQGPIVVSTGKHTARAASDKFVVRESTTEENVWWGQYNRPFAPEKFDALFARLQAYLQGRDVFVQDCYGGSDPDYRLPVRVVTELAWHSLFARNMFIKPQTSEEYRRFSPHAADGLGAMGLEQTLQVQFLRLAIQKTIIPFEIEAIAAGRLHDRPHQGAPEGGARRVPGRWQIRAVLERRDRMKQEIDKLVAANGAAKVFVAEGK